jgi:hypothetical protein
MSGGQDLKGLEKAVLNAIESHGHALQFVALRQFNFLSARGLSEWEPLVAEFPVSCGDHETRVDFVLKHKTRDLYLSCECKRPDPKFTSWVFLRTNVVPGSTTGAECFQFQYSKLQDAGDSYAAFAKAFPLGPFGVNLGMVIQRKRTQTQNQPEGESEFEDSQGRGGKDKKDIEQTAFQAFLGSVGLSRAIRQGERGLAAPKNFAVIPMIVTTANLYISDKDIGDSDLSTGNLNEKTLSLLPVEWVYLQYHCPAQLNRYREPIFSKEGSLESVLIAGHIRTIPIVKAQSIAKFLETQLIISRIHPT